MRRRSLARFAGLLGVAVLAVTVEAGPTPAAASVPVECDFDGDGHSDLAAGVPGETVYGNVGAGAVNVQFESLHEGVLLLQPNPEPGDRFGQALACGNFNGDAYADLAVGAPGENGESGAVNVFVGTASPDTILVHQVSWSQDSAGVPGVAEPGDEFGGALASGDFNGDGKDDLVIAAPYEDVPAAINGGAVNVLKGTSTGLAAVDKVWYPGSFPQYFDGTVHLFGFALTSGDFTGDGRDDVAVGAPWTNMDDQSWAGSVQLLYGSSDILTTGLELTQASVPGKGPEAVDLFGYALAAGDFDDNGKDDLAVGAPGEQIGGGPDQAGAVNVFYFPGPGVSGPQTWHQDVTGVAGVAEPNDLFGWSLAAGNFDNEHGDDLAIGVPGEDVIGGGVNVPSAGAVNVLYALPGARLGTSANHVLTDPHWEGRFGWSLSALDVYGNSDLMVGAPGVEVAGNAFAPNAGMVHVFVGWSGAGLASGPDLHQGMDGASGFVVANQPEATDYSWEQGYSYPEGERFGHAIG